MTQLNFYLLLPYLFLINASLVSLCTTLYLRNRNIGVSSTSLGAYSIFIFFLTSVLCLNSSTQFSAVAGFIIVLPSSILFILLTLAVASISVLIIGAHDNTLAAVSVNLELYFIRLIIVASLLLMIISENLVLIFFLLEIYSLSAYILVAEKGRFSVFSSESGIKYFILGTLFSLLFIYGTALVYGVVGTANITVIQALLELPCQSRIEVYIGVLLIVIALLFKLAAAPLHFWAPTVYEAAPTSAMLFLSVVPKTALMVALIKLHPICAVLELTTIFYIASVLSILIGSVGGIYQRRIKSLLVYSSINGTGFLIAPLMSIDLSGSMPTFVLFLIFYLLTSLSLFSVLYSLKALPNYTTIKNLRSLSNLLFTHKTLAVGLSLILLSSAGLPPFVGFFTKFFILSSISSSTASISLFFILLAASASVFYYIRIIKAMSFAKYKNYVPLLSKLS